jgi:hypothetical protein
LRGRCRGQEVARLNGRRLRAVDAGIGPARKLHRVAEGLRLLLVLLAQPGCDLGGFRACRNRETEAVEVRLEGLVAQPGIFAKQGKSKEYDLLSKTSANLMRMWVDD